MNDNQSGVGLSVSARAQRLVEQLVEDATALRCVVSKGQKGETRIDCGAATPGGLEAGRRLGEICLGGLGTVSFTNQSGLENWPLGLMVHTTNPVIACLGSQYAGWSIHDEESGFLNLIPGGRL